MKSSQTQNHFSRQLLPVVAYVLMTVPQAVVAEMFAAPIETSGNLGYSYRSLNSDVSGESVSHQLRSSIKAHTWLWQPWLATADLGFSGTFDDSKAGLVGASTTNTATILTGDLNLGILSQSRTPLQVSFRASDSRVETISDSNANPLTGLGAREYSTQRLAIKQRYFTEDGHRYQAYLDRNNWDSNGDSYTDWLLGADMSIRLPKHNFTGKASYQNSDYSVLDQVTRTTVLNLDHFYYPDRALRIDTMGSLYLFDRTSNQPLNSTNKPDSTTDLAQLSTFVFWRPEDRPISLSGGVRLYDLTGDTAGNSLAVQNISATAGMLYQWTKNLRFDANTDLTTNDNDGEQITTSRYRAGALYQSDIHDVLGGMTWQWYSNLSAQLRDADGDKSGTADLNVGHETQKIWMRSRNESWRFSFSQSGSQSRLSDNGSDADNTRMNHSTSLSWNLNGEAGMVSVQTTLADSRQTGDSKNDQQFFNFQVLSNWNVDRLQSLNGNFTLQKVIRDFNGSINNDTVTTATGQINYNHSRIMGIPHLRFASDLRYSEAVTDEWVNRGEWENRLDYVIGLLDTRISWRRTVLDSDSYDLVYFQVSRRF